MDWTKDQANRFLDYTAGDPLGLMFCIAVLHGPRRGELCGFRWSGADLDAGYLTADRPILQLGGKIEEGKPKTRESRRRIWLDDDTLEMMKAHGKAQVAARLRHRRPGRTTT